MITEFTINYTPTYHFSPTTISVERVKCAMEGKFVSCSEQITNTGLKIQAASLNY